MGVERRPQPGGTHPGPEPKPPPAGPRPPGGGAAGCGEGAESVRLRQPLGCAGGRCSGTPGRWNLRAGESSLESVVALGRGEPFACR